MTLWSRLVNSLRAFREEFVTTGTYGDEDFADPEARKVRYDILWAQYENTVFRSTHRWAGAYKTRYALYRYIRSIYNPAYRIGEFWKAHLWGGILDADAEETGALPVITANETLRPGIADVWRWSNWPTKKDVVSLHGAVYGDVIMRVVDSPEHGKVYLETVFPGTITELTKDPFGNVKGYILEEERLSPNNNRPVTYKETAERSGEDVIYRTYLNDVLYPWNGVSQWSKPYGFVPMVHIQHNDVGLEWGWSELHPSRSKMHELDDLGSLLSDQIRKSVNAKWFFAGVKAGNTSATMTTTETTARPEPGREEEPALYSPNPQAKPIPMVAPIDIEGSVLHISEVLKDLERDYPELKFDALRVSGEVSGQTLRVARQPVETKVLQRRANYDDALKRALQMALTIGGLRGLFPSISLDSYEGGALDFEFGDRPVFTSDVIEEYDEEKALWLAAKEAKAAGLPLAIFLKRMGWSEEELAELAASPEMQARQQMLETLGEGGFPPGDEDADDSGEPE